MTLPPLVNIDVDDLSRGIDFYCSAFELRLGRRCGEGAAELLGASSAIYGFRRDHG